MLDFHISIKYFSSRKAITNFSFRYIDIFNDDDFGFKVISEGDRSNNLGISNNKIIIRLEKKNHHMILFRKKLNEN